jgi:hypothetical protein
MDTIKFIGFMNEMGNRIIEEHGSNTKIINEKEASNIINELTQDNINMKNCEDLEEELERNGKMVTPMDKNWIKSNCEEVFKILQKNSTLF